MFTTLAGLIFGKLFIPDDNVARHRNILKVIQRLKLLFLENNHDSFIKNISSTNKNESEIQIHLQHNNFQQEKQLLVRSVLNKLTAKKSYCLAFFESLDYVQTFTCNKDE